ncbi:uncharacterized protein EI90DRAFT_3286718 [Cantharellus anzutake]|uniref:uncharacterized protein n=1 Tax=Cantharellus anzutake TaxID=1750568 RepID=UPI001904E0E4|nr:uncharacterized protein EI90DRAFT_3286718 [Cantharellus anzutake]KAF8337918.1 hypothetical protein EI90DRAFT_3286718 [Cantharellus anzutake]
MSAKRRHDGDEGDSEHASPPRRQHKSQQRAIGTDRSPEEDLQTSVSISFSSFGSEWFSRGSNALKDIVIFGDSYSSDNLTWSKVGSLGDALGLSTEHVHNFAVPGATAENGLISQIKRYLANDDQPEDEDEDLHPVDGSIDANEQYLEPNETLYIIWIGINDCGNGANDSEAVEEILEEQVFDEAVHNLYVKAGARNFVFMDVPPLDRCPAVHGKHPHDLTDRVEAWNCGLMTQIKSFMSPRNRQQTTSVILYSMWQTVTDILDSFTGDPWSDDLHLNAETHDIVADRVAEALRSCLS